MKSLWSLLKQSAISWNNHNAQSMGAALAYYSVLSMAPLIVITIAIAGFAFTKEAAQGQIVYEMRDTVGSAGAQVIQSVLQNAGKPSSGVVATLLSALTLLISASGVFVELRASLNRIWDVPAGSQPSGMRGTVRFYIFSFAMVLTIGFLLLVSLVLSAVLELFEHWMANRMPSLPLTAKLFNLGLSFTVISVLFGLIYKYVPDAHIRWGDVVHGALTTALLFTLGKYALAVYIGKMSVGSAYGAAGSMVALLVWVYYSAQIFFFGAEFTHIYALREHHVRAPGITSIGPRSATPPVTPETL